MADATTIEWMIAVARSRRMRAAVWNPIRGCSPKSAGCLNCWAAPVADMRGRQSNQKTKLRYEGLTTRNATGKPVFNGITRLVEMDLDLPLRTRKRTAYFVCSEADLFGEGVADEWLDRIFAIMAMCPQHLFICLTKRPARMRAYFREHPRPRRAWEVEIRARGTLHISPPCILKNVWFGVSVENQETADERIPDLLETPAALRWISAEPLLGPVDLAVVDPRHVDGELSSFTQAIPDPRDPCGKRHLDWVVVGGESGRGARPSHPDWFRSLRDQCASVAVPFFFKQWGEYHPSAEHAPDERRCGDTPEAIHVSGDREFRPGEQYRLIASKVSGWAGMCRIGKKAAGHLLDGVEHLAVPGER